MRERGVTVLAKPVSLDRLSAAIAEVLGGAASPRIDPGPPPAGAPLAAAGPSPLG